MTVAIVLLALLGSAWLLAVVEGWMATGRLSPAAPLFRGLAHLGRESIVPRSPDRVFFEAAPVLLLVVAVLGMAVLPLAPDLIIADLGTGALFVNAALAYVLVAVIMAGWGPDGAYAMIGGWRFLGQLIAYSMLIVMPITAVAMRAESLVNTAIVGSQAGLTSSTSPWASCCFILRPWHWHSAPLSTCLLQRGSLAAVSTLSIPGYAWRCFALPG